jgi:hypothetical protein
MQSDQTAIQSFIRVYLLMPDLLNGVKSYLWSRNGMGSIDLVGDL